MNLLFRAKYTLKLFAIFIIYFFYIRYMGPIPKLLTFALTVLYILRNLIRLKAELLYIPSEIKKWNEKQLNNQIEQNLLNSEGDIQALMSESLESIKELRESTIKKSSQSSEDFKVFLDLEEKYNFLEGFDKRMIDIFKRGVTENLPSFLSNQTYTAIDGIKNEIDGLCSLSANNLKKFDSMSNDVVKSVENSIFSKFGIDLKQACDDYKRIKTEFNKYYDDILEGYQNDIYIIERGVIGEKRLKEELELFEDVLTCLYNVRLQPEPNQSIETDVIAISSNGVFSIEAKNYGEDGSYDIEITKDGQWLKVYSNGNAVPMDDVGSQGNRHIGIAQRFLNKKMKECLGGDIPYIYIEPIYVIANDKVRIDNYSELAVLRCSQVYNYIRSQQSNLPKEYINIIKEIFESHKLQAKKYAQRDYYREFESLLKYSLPWFVYYTKLGAKHEKYLEILKSKGFITEDFFNRNVDTFIPLQFVQSAQINHIFGEGFTNNSNDELASALKRFLYD